MKSSWQFLMGGLLLLVAGTTAYAQQKLIRFQHIDPSRSFASRYILAVTQDERGFLWFASLYGGLARYDGYEFKIYAHDPDDSGSLPANEVHSLFAEPSGYIWAGTVDGLVRIDTRTDEITTYRHEPDNPGSLSHSSISPVLVDSRGTLWVGTENGLNRKDPGSQSFRHYPLEFESDNPRHVLPAQWVWSLHEDSAGRVWVGTLGGGLLLYDRSRDDFQRILHDPEDPASLPENVVRAIAEDNDGDIWVGTANGLARLVNAKLGRFETVRPREIFHEKKLPGVEAIEFDTAGNLWVSLGDAIMFRPAASDTFQLIEHDPTDTGSLGSGRVWTIFEDRSGVVWVPSDSISWVVPSTHAFTLFPRQLPIVGSEDHLTLDSTGMLWTGSRNGLIALNLNSRKWISHVPFPDSESISGNWIKGSGIYEDPVGRLWVSTAHQLSLFDRAEGTFDPIDLPVEPNDMVMGSDGLLWLALPFKGFASLDPTSSELHIYAPDESDPTSVSHAFGYAVYEDSQRRLWYGTHKALNLFDRQTARATRFFSRPGGPSTLSNDSVRQILEDDSGRLWFGTQFGLNRLDDERGQFVRYFNGMSASHNTISSMVTFGDGFLWLATDAGIARFDTVSGLFKNFSYPDGLPANFRRKLQAGDDGILWALTSGGFLAIDTKRLETDSNLPPVVLTDFRIFNRSVPVSSTGAPTPLTAGPEYLDSITLSHTDQVVSFTFSALDFAHPSSNLYQYRLEGLNEQWIASDASRRVATFTDLAPGNYRLRVRGAGRNGLWNEAAPSLGIRVLPPPWRTWWAYLLYGTAFLALLSAFIRWRTRLLRIHSTELQSAVDERTHQLMTSERTVRNQSQNLQELLELKERLFTNISHEFRTPLTLMLGPIEHAIRESRNPQVIAQLNMARRNGKRVLRLVDQLLELSRLSSDEPLKLAPHPLKPMVEVVCEAFRPYAREKGIALSVTTDGSLWVNCVPEAIERITMNLVSNALKFTSPGGRVHVVLRESLEHDGRDDIELQVFDTGRGIPQHQQDAIFERFKRADDMGEAVPGSGIGLALVKELSEAHGGRVRLESTPGKGTVVSVLLPASRVKAGVDEISDSITSDALRLEVDVLEEPCDPAAQGSDDEASGKPRLLLIEDNRDMQYYLQQLLSDQYRVRLAGDGETGLGYAREDIPDLVICDVMLPKRDGYEVSHELKSDQRTSHIPIIMLTARTDEDSRLEGLREHVDDFLTKPFNDEELMLRVANLLAIRDILKARYSGQLITGQDPSSSLREPERRFLERLEKILDRNYASQDFTIAEMASAMALSTRQLQRKLRALTDQQPAHYLRLYRLNRSLDLLKKGKLVGDVAFSVGFGSPAHFSSCFRAQYGCTPTEFQGRSRNSGSA